MKMKKDLLWMVCLLQLHYLFYNNVIIIGGWSFLEPEDREGEGESDSDPESDFELEEGEEGSDESDESEVIKVMIVMTLIVVMATAMRYFYSFFNSLFVLYSPFFFLIHLD